ncbi:cysteine desulfurase [Patescibacteria group bacterium]|nr:cysteine desulfurase [Patescibacteria group bacterium]
MALSFLSKIIRSRGRRVYLDYVAATPVDPRVVSEMTPYFNTFFGNPGGIHSQGVEAKHILEAARLSIASQLNAKSNEIIFTAGGTEANNLAILGTVASCEAEGRVLSDMHFITSAVEHPSVLDNFKRLQKRGAHVTYVSVDRGGRIDPKHVRRALTKQTVLVSIMYVNNEIGTIQPIRDIAKEIRFFNKHIKKDTSAVYPYFHTDASQAIAFIKVNVLRLGVNLLTMDAQKIYGPKGIGALYKSRKTGLTAVFAGGDQEFGLRPGTENIPSIVGFARSLSLVADNRDYDTKRLTRLRDYFIAEVLQKIPRVELNGEVKDRIPNNVNFSIPGMDNEFMVILLDARGIAIGTRSACLGHDGGSSYVIEALGKSKEITTSSLRFSLGRATTQKDIDYVVRVLVEIVANFDKRQKS